MRPWFDKLTMTDFKLISVILSLSKDGRVPSPVLR